MFTQTKTYSFYNENITFLYKTHKYQVLFSRYSKYALEILREFNRKHLIIDIRKIPMLI